jgi:ATP-dependent Clp protease ATP-binding subunit ClpA
MVQNSPDVERLVASAAIEQRELGHDRVGTEHLLLALLADQGSESAELLTTAGATWSAARHMVSEVAVRPSEPTPPGEAVRFTSRAQRALDRAGRFARQERASSTTEQHVLLGVLDVEGLACQVLRRLGVDLSRLRAAITGDIGDAGEVGGDGDDFARTDAVDEPTTSSHATDPDVRPLCGVCRAPLDDHLAIATVAAANDDPTSVRIVHCGSCGNAIGVVP